MFYISCTYVNMYVNHTSVSLPVDLSSENAVRLHAAESSEGIGSRYKSIIQHSRTAPATACEFFLPPKEQQWERRLIEMIVSYGEMAVSRLPTVVGPISTHWEISRQNTV